MYVVCGYIISPHKEPFVLSKNRLMFKVISDSLHDAKKTMEFSHSIPF